jgi:polysaccharide biosynthesis transport protein
MEVKQYLSLLQHWAWLLIIGLVLGAGIAYGYSSQQTPVFRTSARIQVVTASASSSNPFSFYTDQQLAQTYVQTLKTSPILDAVSQKLGYAVAAGQISAAIVPNTQLIDIAVEDSDPQNAANIANVLVTVFAQSITEAQSKRFSASEESLKTQIAQVESQIVSLQAQSSVISEAKIQESIDKSKVEMERLQSEIVAVKAEINKLRIRPKNIYGVTPTPSPEIVSQIDERELQLKQLETNYNQFSDIYSNLVVLGSGSGNADSNTQQMQSTLAIYQQIRSNLLSSYETIRLTRLTSATNIASIEPATAPGQPIRPTPLNTTGLGAVVGLLLAGAIVFLIEYLDDTIKTAEQVNQLLGLPVIGYIAEIEHGQDTTYVSDNPRSPVTEAFRTLRTNLEFAGVDQPLKTLLVVSVHPGEGKSTIAANLSITLAQGEKRVLLVDADLRRPHIHSIFGLANRAGLSDLFREPISLADVTRSWKDSKLGIVTSGGIPPNPADLLASKKMESILGFAKQAVDIVIVDAPPFLVADASILASRVDGILLVIRPGKTPMDAAISTLEQIKRSGGRIVGVVLNRIPRNRPYYYGGYRHYTAYYNNGYSYYDTAPRKESSNRGGGWSIRNLRLFGNRQKTPPNAGRTDSPPGVVLPDTLIPTPKKRLGRRENSNGPDLFGKQKNASPDLEQEQQNSWVKEADQADPLKEYPSVLPLFPDQTDSDTN